MADEQQNMRRMPAIARTIDKIRQDDIRVSVVGTVVDRNENAIILDDGTGQVRVVFEDASPEQKALVRVFGRVIPTEDGIEIRAEFFQDMKGLDLDLYRKAEEIRS